MNNYSEFEKNIKLIIDKLQGLCSSNGLSNSADEESIVTSIFLYKFLNDKFMANLKEFSKKANKKIDDVIKNKDNILEAFYFSYPQDVAFKFEDTIDYLVQHLEDDDFYIQFDNTLIRISNYKENQTFSIETSEGEKKPLFEKISDKIQESKKNSFIKSVFSFITRDQFDFGNTFENKYDFFSTIFEYLIQNYNVASGTYAEYFTPQILSKAISKILVNMSATNEDSYEIYDPSAGSGSLVLHLAHELGEGNFGNKAKVYTQDISRKSTKFLRINMLLNGLKESLNNIIEGDTLENPSHFQTKGDDTSGIKKFDFITSNPPFKTDFSTTRDKIQVKWEKTDRFFAGIPLIKKAKKGSMEIYLCFMQHILYSLKENGKAAIVVPSGFLTAQKGIEKIIREYITNKGWLKGVISMPSNIFANTGTNVSVIFIDKSNKSNKALLMDASRMGKKVKNNNQLQKTELSEKEINLIINTFINCEEKDSFSISVNLDDIKSKNFNWSAGQYFDIKPIFEEISEEKFKKIINEYKSKIKMYFQESDKLQEKILKELEKI